MRTYLVCFGVLLLGFFSHVGMIRAADLTADEIMSRAEDIRNPTDDYTCKVKLSEYRNKKLEENKSPLFTTKVKGRDKAYVVYLAPNDDKDTAILLVGSDMHIKVKGKGNAIRIAANQKLVGNAAYGDVARLSFVGNYKPKILRNDTFEGQDAYVLELNSIPDRPVTYDIIEYWVDKKSFRPLRAIYKTASRKDMREAKFADYEDVFGVQRPTKMILVNLLSKDHYTEMKFTEAKKGKISDSRFEKINMGRNI